MTTTHHVKMAKASRADLDAAFALHRAFEYLLSYGYEPAESEDDEREQRFDIDDHESCRRVLDRLLAIARRGSLMRVVMGLDVLLDPRNEIVDPDLDYLAPHPKALAAFAAAAANASGTDSPHSAAGEARTEERSADANHRKDRDREGARDERQPGAPGDGDQGVEAGLRQHDGVPGCGGTHCSDQRAAVRDQGAGGGVPAGAEPADSGGVLAAAQLTRVADALYAALSRFPADPSPIDVAGDPDGATTTEWTLAALELQTVAIEQSRRLAAHRTPAGLPTRTNPDVVAGTPATSDDRGGPDDGAPPAPPALDAGGGGVSGLDLVAHLRRQRDFSLRTFGPGPRSAGVVDHIRKELLEIEAAPSDLAEWIDVVILAFDGAWRIGATPEQIVTALLAKQAKNEARTWPDWRKADPSKAIEHDRSRDGGAG